MSTIPDFPIITEEMKQDYTYWAIDDDGEFWIYKYKPKTYSWYWHLYSTNNELDIFKVAEFETLLKDWKKAIGKLSDGKPDNWESLWVTTQHTTTQHETVTVREVLTALLEGKEVQKTFLMNGTDTISEWEKPQYFPFSVLSVDMLDKPASYTGESGTYIYRIKPETKTVRVFNGVELPDCITEPLHAGEVYYVALIQEVREYVWRGSRADMKLLESGHVYKTRKDAETHYHAITKYDIIEKEVF